MNYFLWCALALFAFCTLRPGSTAGPFSAKDWTKALISGYAAGCEAGLRPAAIGIKKAGDPMHRDGGAEPRLTSGGRAGDRSFGPILRAESSGEAGNSDHEQGCEWLARN